MPIMTASPALAVSGAAAARMASEKSGDSKARWQRDSADPSGGAGADAGGADVAISAYVGGLKWPLRSHHLYRSPSTVDGE